MLTANLDIWLGMLRQQPQWDQDRFFTAIRDELEDVSNVLDRVLRETDIRVVREAVQEMGNRHKPTGGATTPNTCRHCGKRLP
jgi:hypothetical protein